MCILQKLAERLTWIIFRAFCFESATENPILVRNKPCSIDPLFLRCSKFEERELCINLNQSFVKQNRAHSKLKYHDKQKTFILYGVYS
jgi:hypothetical protein